MSGDTVSAARDVIFISKGTPEDDDFVLWLAPRLEALGYKVFADILWLEPGMRWRKEITDTLYERAAKMLLCCRDSTLAKAGVQEEIGIATELSKDLNDPQFIMPLKLERFRKLFGMGELQYLNFEGRWAQGLQELDDKLRKHNVPRNSGSPAINPNWENYKRRDAIVKEDRPEPLTSNWLRIAEIPDTIRYFQPSGPVNLGAMQRLCREARYPAEVYQRGFFTFLTLDEVNTLFGGIGRFTIAQEMPLWQFIEAGADSPAVRPREASNLVISMFRRAWETYCRDRALYEYSYGALPGFHVSTTHVGIGKKIAWGMQGQKRSAMLRNKAQGRIWNFGVTGMPALWPFPHFKFKSRVLFAEANGTDEGSVFQDKDLQHRLRRRVCKGWRNKQWHGRLMALLQVLAGDEAFLRLPLADREYVKLDATPMILTSPVSTVLPDIGRDEDEETGDHEFEGSAYAEGEG